jgi:hypothetical protein
VKCQNLFAEQATSVPDRPVALLSCPGIESYSTLGGSACTGLARQDGVFNGDIFAVSTNTLYRVNSSATASSIGSVGTDGDLSRFAFIRPTSTATQGYVATLASVAGTVYLYDNSTLTTISDVDVGSSVRDGNVRADLIGRRRRTTIVCDIDLGSLVNALFVGQ